MTPVISYVTTDDFTFFFLVMLLQGQCILKRGHTFYHNYSTSNVKFEKLPHFSDGFCAMIAGSVLLASFIHFVFMREQKHALVTEKACIFNAV